MEPKEEKENRIEPREEEENRTEQGEQEGTRGNLEEVEARRDRMCLRNGLNDIFVKIVQCEAIRSEQSENGHFS